MQCSMQCVHMQEWPAHHHLHLCWALHAVSSFSCLLPDVPVRRVDQNHTYTVYMQHFRLGNTKYTVIYSVYIYICSWGIGCRV